MPIYTIRNMTCGGSSIPHVVRPPFESQWTEQCPIVGKPHRKPHEKNPYIQNITHQEMPVCTNLERPGDLPLAHVSACSYRQLTYYSLSHSQTALNPAASILAR